jgi:aminopeptidase
MRSVAILCIVSLWITTHGAALAKEHDGPVEKLAKVLVHHSLQLKAGDTFFIMTSPEADELNVAVLREAVRAGAHVEVMTKLPHQDEIYLRHANDRQLDYVSPVIKHIVEKADAILMIAAPSNTRALAGFDPARLSRRRKATGKILGTLLQRIDKKTLRLCETGFPTSAAAQEAGMGYYEYRDFVFKAGLLHLDDPMAAWKKIGAQQMKRVKRLAGKTRVAIKGKNVDLRLSIKGRTFISADGKLNFPDGEIFTSPVETSASGWVRFGYPLIHRGQEMNDVQLWFKDGKVTRFKAGKGEETLRTLLKMDAGASVLGELGIGTNYDIKRFSKNMLFDEKIGGTIHLAIGNGFPEAGGKNRSSIHVDMLCDVSDGEIRVDDVVVYRKGKFID